MAVYRVKKEVEHALTPDVMNGRASLPLGDFRLVLDEHVGVDLELLRHLLDHALTLDVDKERELDQWLSPRFHFAMRIPRRIAGDPGFWTWLTLEIGQVYTFYRWGKENAVTMYRYTGDFKRNALARLWWFSEMARNGPSYDDVRRVLRDPSTAQYAMELKYSMYRPAVIAFGRVAETRSVGFESLKGLSKRINAYLSLRSLESLGFSENDETFDEAWWSDQPSVSEVLGEEIAGPHDGFAREEAIAELVRWFTALLDSRGLEAEPSAALRRLA
jgi:hypothetical protein